VGNIFWIKTSEGKYLNVERGQIFSLSLFFVDFEKMFSFVYRKDVWF
jgi:hypothetical protein